MAPRSSFLAAWRLALLARVPIARVVLAAAGLALVALPVRAAMQDAQDASSTPRVARPATVNGESITDEDIALLARQLLEGVPDAPIEVVLVEARRRLAEEVLMAGEARRLGIEITDRQVEDYWQQRFGEALDALALAARAGTTVERQRTIARRVVLADLYLLHRTGLRSELRTRIAPDPALARLVAVTPSQLRETFASLRDELGLPERVGCALYPCADAEQTEAVRVALLSGEPPGVERVERELPVSVLDEVFPPEVAAFLREQPPGSLVAHVGETGAAVLEITTRRAAEPAEFAESQERLRGRLQSHRLGQARLQLVADLAQRSTYWPRDLFDASGPVAPPRGGP